MDADFRARAGEPAFGRAIAARGPRGGDSQAIHLTNGDTPPAGPAACAQGSQPPRGLPGPPLIWIKDA